MRVQKGTSPRRGRQKRLGGGERLESEDRGIDT